MTKRREMNCDLYLTEREDGKPGWSVNLQQFPVTLNLRATNEAFLNVLNQFLDETLNNPRYRDEEISTGVFRRMPEKFCDLSVFFDFPIKVLKDGEYDDAYVVQLELNDYSNVSFDLRGEAVWALKSELEAAISFMD